MIRENENYGASVGVSGVKHIINTAIVKRKILHFQETTWIRLNAVRNASALHYSLYHIHYALAFDAMMRYVYVLVSWALDSKPFDSTSTLLHAQQFLIFLTNKWERRGCGLTCTVYTVAWI